MPQEIIVVSGGVWGPIGRARWDALMTRMGLNKLPIVSFSSDGLEKVWRGYEDAQIDLFRTNLLRTINQLSPKVLLACGDFSLKSLTGMEGGKKALKYVRGYSLQSWTGVQVIATYEPEAWSRGEGRLFPVPSKYLGLMMEDVSKAFKVARGQEGVCYDPSQEVEVREGVGELKKFYSFAKASPFLPIAYDLETKASEQEDEDNLWDFAREREGDGEDEGLNDPDIPHEWENLSSSDTLNTSKAQITTIQFAMSDSWGVGADWGDEVRSLTQDIMSLPNIKVGHNVWAYDRPILNRYGIDITGPQHDTLWMWHAIQPDLPAHLQAVAQACGWRFPWKHMAGSHFNFYGVVDVCAVIRIWEKLPLIMSRLNAWDGYENLIQGFERILRSMESRGIPMNGSKLGEFRGWLEDKVQEFDRELQKLVPDSLKGVEPKGGYKSIPADIKPLILESRPELFAPTIKTLKNGSTKSVKSKLSWGEVYKSLWDTPSEWEDVWEKIDSIGLKKVGKDRLGYLQPWNCRSPKQLLEYLRIKDHKIPIRFRDGKPTTGDKELEKLYIKTSDPVLKLTRELRAHSKMINAYTGKEQEDGSIVGGWYPARDGRVHSTFTFGPATWQLAAKNPNVLTTPKRREELAKRFRACMEAEDGRVLVECVSPDTLILKEDLTWDRADNIKLGDSLWGFDRDLNVSNESKRSGRYIRTSKVLSVHTLTKPCVTLTTSQGTVTCSEDHLLLVRRNGKATWVQAKDININNPICFFTKPWEVLDTRDSGWLSGFFDGEGYISNPKLSGRGVGFGQNPGLVLDRAKDLITSLGFGLRQSKSTRKCETYNIGGYQFEWLRFVGSIRPIRLLEKALNQMEGMTYWGKTSKSAVVLDKKFIGNQSVVSIETSTGTFFANGMLSHNCDYRAFHARTLGLEAQDSSYMRLADLDIHSYVTGHLVRWPGMDYALEMEDGELREFLETIKSKHKAVRNFKAKPTILGVGFGMGYRRLYFENRESFENEGEARKLLDLLKSLFPKVFAWQDMICDKAERECRLVSKWGAVRWFWEVTRYERKIGGWKKVGGKDAEKVKAFFPANDAHGMLRYKLKEMEGLGYLDKWELINVIHDAVLFHPKVEDMEECWKISKQILETPVLQLADEIVCPEGFTCSAEASVGKDWSKMEDMK